jgi:predicted AAA+ superfamily ATPase
VYVPRKLAAALKVALRQFPAVLVTGPRQSGKTTFLRREFEKEAHYVSFDDPLEREYARRDPNGFLDRFGGERVILDEIQYAPEILSYVKIRIDRDRRTHGRWLLTGSQRFQLMANVSESLAGRVAILELLPFSLLETPASAKDLGTVIWDGLYPEPALEPAKRDLWVSSYVQTYVERDVRQVLNVQDLRTFETLLALCAARHAQELNFAALSRLVGVSQPAVKAWVGVLEAAYVVLRLPPYFEHFGKRVIKTPKLYFLDPALVCALSRQPSAEAALAGAMAGALFEGLIVAEAMKVSSVLGKRPDFYYWRSHDGLEVDLLVPADGRLVPVEIKLTATPAAGHVEPIERWKRVAGKRGGATGLVVCRVPKPRQLPWGHLAMPWQDFPAWLEATLR